MKKDNKKLAVAISIMLAVGAVVAALPLLVEAAVDVTDSGTAEPMWFPNVTQDTGTQTVNSTTYLTITNSGDTINGNQTDQVAGNKWIMINFTDVWFHNTTNGENVSLNGMEVWYRIDSGSWHYSGDWGMLGGATINITDSAGDAYNYTFSSGSTMDIKLEASFATNGVTAATYITGTYTGDDGIKWQVIGYS